MNASASLRDDPDMNDALASRGLLSDVRWFGLLLVLGLLLPVFSMPVQAQVYQDRSSNDRMGRESVQEHAPGQTQSSSPSNLPDWAEPSGSSYSVDQKDAQANATPPTLPGEPEQVPVDGGLALLAAAGAGYAVRKLNEEDEDDPPA